MSTVNLMIIVNGIVSVSAIAGSTTLFVSNHPYAGVAVLLLPAFTMLMRSR